MLFLLQLPRMFKHTRGSQSVWRSEVARKRKVFTQIHANIDASICVNSYTIFWSDYMQIFCSILAHTHTHTYISNCMCAQLCLHIKMWKYKIFGNFYKCENIFTSLLLQQHTHSHTPPQPSVMRALGQCACVCLSECCFCCCHMSSYCVCQTLFVSALQAKKTGLFLIANASHSVRPRAKKRWRWRRRHSSSNNFYFVKFRNVDKWRRKMKKSKGIAPKATAEIKKDNDESTLYICMCVCENVYMCVEKNLFI